MRVAVLADIGQPIYHVGDEAIGQSVVERLQARGAEVVLLTRDVAHTQRHHLGVAAARTLQFPWSPLDAERYLGEIRQVLAGTTGALPPDDQIHEVSATIAGVDALLIAGGGNLNSTYRWLLYERVAIALVAARLGKPVVLTGQTLGPALIEHDRALVAELLGICTLVSLREHRSVCLAREIAPAQHAIWAGLDDAACWPSAPLVGAPPQPAPASGAGRAVATFSPGTGPVPRDEAVEAIAALLDGFAIGAGLTIELVPHMATPGARDEDIAFHEQIVAASASSRLHTRALATAPDAARQIEGAGLVITTRYHPVIFASTLAVPIFALVPDHYTDVRIGGALANVGLAGWCVPLSATLTPMAAEALEAVWQQRTEVAAHLRSANLGLQAGHERRWDDIFTALSGRPIEATPIDFPPTLPPPDQLAAAARAFRHVIDLTGTAEQDRLEAERARARLRQFEQAAAAHTHAAQPQRALPRRLLDRARHLCGRAKHLRQD